jgi:AbiTii
VRARLRLKHNNMSRDLPKGPEINPNGCYLMLFDEETRLLYFRGRMDGAVKVLESVTKRNDGDSFMGKEYAPDICQFMTKKILHNDKLNIVILRLICTIDISEAVQVLAAIRSKLLDFILRLEADVPELAKPLSQISPIEGAGQSTITQIFHNTVITVTGNANTVVTGDSNDTSSS